MARDAQSELLELRRVFREELDDHATTMEREARVLAPGAADEIAVRAAIAEIYRAAHSLKGAAHAVLHPEVGRLCHALEAHLAPIRHATSAVPAARVAALAELTARALRRWAEVPDDDHVARDRICAEALAQIDAGSTAPIATAPAKPRERAASITSPSRVSDGDALDPMLGPAASRPAETVRISVERLGELLTASEDLLSLSAQDVDLASGLAALDESILALRSHLRRARQALRDGSGAASPGAGEAGRLIDQSLSVIQNLMGWSIERARRDTAAWKAVASGASGVAERARALRLVPLDSLFPALDRAAVEAARALGKDIVVRFEGGAAELDRRVRDGLREPLLHLVRNAVDHGIEEAPARLAADKPEVGTVSLRATLSGRDLRIVLHDDGRGIDLDAVRARARAMGLDPQSLDRRETFALLFEPGFTTREAVTSISGRGIGLDVVRKRIAALHGRIDVESEPGRGTTFTLTLPLDLSLIRGLVLGVRDARFVVLTTAVARLVRVHADDVVAVEGRLYIREETGLTPLADLDEVLGFARRGSSLRGPEARPCVVIVAGERRAAFRVDTLLDEREIVVRKLGSRVRRAAFVSGAALLGNNDVALVLDVADLVHLARPGRSAAAAEAEPPRRRILVVDDSITTRQLMRSILETAGYEVTVAADGQEAWDRITAGASFDLVVSDIEMPRMDGLALLTRIRALPRPSRLPFVLVTALESDVERRRALELGANAYVLKGGFDQASLLDTIERIL
ncbi:Signal transduction histidine kinase CheA [Minicystis rosea]|nr:Signal transduction histidine kinase CheA [Minicystis rosea]